MGEKFKNVVCEPGDVVADIKRQILELISLNQTVCGNLPDLSIPNLIPEVTDLNPSQKVMDFLADILALVSGINFEEMRLQLINWLVEQLGPLSEDLSVNFVNSIKSCYACKINPKIPEWLYQIQPSSIQYDQNNQPITGSGTEGLGFNIELNKIDLTCIFAANPNTDIGKLFYDGDSTNDINAFLWEVIQLDGQPLIWSDPTNGKEILEVRYFQNSPIAFTQTDGNVKYQNIEPRPRVFNFKVVNQTYFDKTLITVLVDYFNSQQPLFDVDKVIPNVIDLLYGTLTNKIDLPDECLTNVVELETSISDYLDEGVGNGTTNFNFDDSFYTFDNKQLLNIKEKVREKKSGVREYKKCCGKNVSSISFDTVLKINDELKNSSTLEEKISTYSKALDTLINESTSKVNSLDIDSAAGEFLSNLITSLQIVLTKLVLSPKNLLMLNLFYFLVNSKSITEISVKKILKEFECVIVEILSELLRKLIYEYLLPLVIKALKNLIACVITKKIKEKKENFQKSKLSLLPGFINDKLEDVNELFGKSENIIDKAKGFTDKVNLNSLNNINLQSKKRGRFCD